MRRLPFSLGALLVLSGLLWLSAGDGRARVAWRVGDLLEAVTTTASASAAAPVRPERNWLLLDAQASTSPGDGRSVNAGAPAELRADAPAPEAMVQQAYELARTAHGTEAAGMLEAVLHREPQFRPALGLQGLLAAEWSQPAADAEDERAPLRHLQPPPELTEEAALRWAALRHRASHRHEVPANLLQVGDQVRTVLAADLSESRLYVLSHDQRGLWLQSDYYLSTGMRGSFKQNPGDQRTPIGIYALQPRLPADQLPTLAGHAAWPLAFPNRWDQWQGHLGSGIWLHGSAPGQYDGLPHSTNGCLALSNRDIDQLAPALASSATILLVAEHLDWISPVVLGQRRTNAIQRLQARGGASARPQASDSLYSYPGEAALLLLRRADGSARSQDQFWPAGALEPLPAAHS